MTKSMSWRSQLQRPLLLLVLTEWLTLEKRQANKEVQPPHGGQQISVNRLCIFRHRGNRWNLIVSLMLWWVYQEENHSTELLCLKDNATLCTLLWYVQHVLLFFQSLGRGSKASINVCHYRKAIIKTSFILRDNGEAYFNKLGVCRCLQFIIFILYDWCRRAPKSEHRCTKLIKNANFRIFGKPKCSIN